MDEGYRAVVLAGTEQRAEHLQALLREQGVRTAVDFALHALPEPGKAVIAVGGLSAGLEFPALRFAILTEGGARPRQKAAPGGDQPRQTQILCRPVPRGPGGP